MLHKGDLMFPDKMEEKDILEGKRASAIAEEPTHTTSAPNAIWFKRRLSNGQWVNIFSPLGVVKANV